MTMCPCTSGISYAQCCEPFHDGAIPETALQLMRSRFSAYALGNIEYISKTTHPENPSFQEAKNEGYYKDYSFDKLEIIDFQQTDAIASVTFKAFLRFNGQDTSFTEKSFFEKINGQWLYKDGVTS